MSLRAKLLLPLLLVSAVMGAYLYAVWIPRTLAHDEAVQIRAVDQHLDSVVEGLIPLLLGNQLDIIHENLNALQQKRPDWVTVRLVNADGKQLYPLISDRRPGQERDGPDVRTLRKPIHYLDMSLGQLTVKVDLAPALANTKRADREIAALLAGILGIFVVTIVLTLEIAVRRPVRRLADASMELARGNFEALLPQAGHDEVGDLVSSFAVMRSDLRSSRANLLEEVAEREQAELALTDALEQTIGVLSRAIERRDAFTDGHQKRVSLLAVAIAEEMGLPPDSVTGIRLGSLVHDVGKIQVPAEILSRPGKLTELEFTMVKVYPQAGHDILTGASFPWPVARMVLEHHERMDGSGYPNGLRGDAICIEARIIAVADVVEAMSHHRPYRGALGIEAAVAEIRQNRGRLYDPQVVDCCIAVLEKRQYAFWQP